MHLYPARETQSTWLLRANSKRLRNHLVAKAELKAEHGKIKQTGAPGHYSLWLRAAHLAVGPLLFKVSS